MRLTRRRKYPFLIRPTITRLPPASLLLWRARWWSPIDRLIAAPRRSLYCHASMCVLRGDDRLLNWEAGGNDESLADLVKRYPQRIDAYEPNTEDRWPHWRADKTERAMREIMRTGYGWRSIWLSSLCRIPGVRMFLPARMDDCEDLPGPPVCSSALAKAYRAGGVDVVPGCPDWLVEPADLARSLFFSYVGTLELPVPF